MELLDLRLSGIAAYTSALLFRLKVEHLFQFEKYASQKIRPDLTDEAPPTIPFSFRYEMTSTSVEDLIAAIERILEEGERRAAAPTSPLIAPEPELQLDDYRVRIQQMLADFRTTVLGLLQRGPFYFEELVQNMNAMGQVRRFVMLLFLAMEGIVNLEEQDERILVSSPIGHAALE